MSRLQKTSVQKPGRLDLPANVDCRDYSVTDNHSFNQHQSLGLSASRCSRLQCVSLRRKWTLPHPPRNYVFVSGFLYTALLEKLGMIFGKNF